MKTTNSTLNQCPTPESHSIRTQNSLLQSRTATMKQYHSQTQPQARMYDSDDANYTPGKLMIPTKAYTVAQNFEKKDRSWSVTSDIPTDLSIQVEDITFNVHKYAVLSKSGYIGRVDLHPTNSDFRCDIKLDNFPGGAASFEVVLKFCYGLPLELSPNNVALLRCASELLEMTEEFEEGNLISKTEAFLTFIVLASWRDSIMVLKTCENLSPWAENLQIVRRCCDSISGKAFQDKRTIGELTDDKTWWFDDVANLRIDHFVRIIAALKSKGTKPEIIGLCITHYAEKWLPGVEEEILGQQEHWCGSGELQLSIVTGRIQEGPISQSKEQKMIIESLVSILPPQKEAVSCKFLLWMLKMAMIYSITPALISELEKRAGLVLLDATVQDLLIFSCDSRDQGKPISSPEKKTMYSTDTVQRIVEYFLMHEQENQSSENLEVSKLLDNYLAEIAADPNLTISTFQALAEALPENARVCHDGLYRAIDIYLKTHPSLQEHDRKRLCKVMSCQKLSFDACMHIAQNDRLPLKIVIQVLFSEQAKMRVAMQTKDHVENVAECEDEESWSSAKKEINTLKTELEKVKEKMSELQRDYSELQREYEKHINKQQSTSSWILRWRKILNTASFNGKVEADSGEQKKRRPSNLGRRQSIS
ncbi:hypothetical protein KSS87_012896 [Heliosperma pusillum]|nr:hypothetical protein KSS87_008566 [Heliosperma pusillum]KAH9619776.1 hypothetical protein KSS87_012896 [Heliosperma pusillum]